MVIILIFLGTIGGLLASVVLLLAMKARLARRVFLATLGLHSAYLVITIAAFFFVPRTIVKAGDSYCYDSWCLGVTKVTSAPRAEDSIYKVDVRVFSDAGRGKQSGAGASLYLVDEEDRRFPLIHDPSVIPFDRSLDPGEAIETTLTFAVPGNTRQLFLMKEQKTGLPFIVKCLSGLWVGDVGEKYVHKYTLLRVL